MVARARLAEGLGLEVRIHLCEVSNEERALPGRVTFVLSYMLAVSAMKCKFIRETIAKIRLHRLPGIWGLPLPHL